MSKYSRSRNQQPLVVELVHRIEPPAPPAPEETLPLPVKPFVYITPQRLTAWQRAHRLWCMATAMFSDPYTLRELAKIEAYMAEFWGLGEFGYHKNETMQARYRALLDGWNKRHTKSYDSRVNRDRREAYRIKLRLKKKRILSPAPRFSPFEGSPFHKEP